MAEQITRITPDPLPFDPAELWRYRDLIWLLTRRGILVGYKQTILGPGWILLQPLLSSLVYGLVFGGVAGIGTDGAPGLLFYLSGTAVWTFFSACVTKTALCFRENANLMGKVWFPRLAAPVSGVFCAGFTLLVQMTLVIGVLGVCAVRGAVSVNWAALPGLIFVWIQLGVLGLGIGLILSVVTVTYRDLHVLVGFGMQLWMYASPILYPASAASGWVERLIRLNPVTAPVELMRFCLWGGGSVDGRGLTWSAGVTMVAAFLGIRAFARAERNFVDRV